MAQIIKNSSEIKLLIEKNNDAHKQFIELHTYTKNGTLSAFFLKAADRHRVFSLQLVSALKSIAPEADFDVEGSFSSAIGRTWLDIKVSLQLITDTKLLEIAEGTYEKLKESYNNLVFFHETFTPIVEDHIRKIDSLLNEIIVLKG